MSFQATPQAGSHRLDGLKTIAAIGAIQVVGIVVGVGRSKATALLLGPEGVGVVSVVEQVVNLLVQLCTFSLPFAAVRFLSRSHSRGAEAFQRTYAGLMQALLVATLGGMVVALAVLWAQPEWVGEDLWPYRTLLVAGVLTIPLVGLQGFFRNVVAAAGRARTSAVLDVIVISMLTAGIIGGIVRFGTIGYFIGQLVAGVVVVGAVTVVLRRRSGLRAMSGGVRIRDELRANPDIFPFAVVMYVVGFSHPLALLMARYGVLNTQGEAEAGLLQAAMALGLSLGMVLNPANGLYLTPLLNRENPANEKMEAAQVFQRHLMVALGALAMPIVLVPDLLLRLLYSVAFVSVAGHVFLFVAAQVLIQVTGVYQATVIGLGDIKVYGLLQTGANLILGGVSWLLVPRLGIAGVGYALLISSGTLSLVLIARLVRSHGMPLPWKQLLSVAYVVGALVMVGWLTRGLHPWSVPVLAGRLVIYLGFMTSLLWLFLDSTERRALWAPVAALAGLRRPR